ncbi:MAG TPA: hypothetical protein EYQ38_02450 [Candidatus Pelagibacter sp.]|jgi:hypothetical protein|nr:hypothetical protein [Candidatus Pelagibacter sp.]
MININNEVYENLRTSLTIHHQLYKKIRCKAEYLEELLTSSFESANYKVKWKPASHDKKKDLVVNGKNLSIKSGVLKPQKKMIEISGHRLTRFKHDLNEITNYLNKSTDTLCVYNPQKNSQIHKYSLSIINKEKFSNLQKNKWQERKNSFKQINDFGVEFSIQKSMSDQVWWKIPVQQLELNKRLI